MYVFVDLNYYTHYGPMAFFPGILCSASILGAVQCIQNGWRSRQAERCLAFPRLALNEQTKARL